MGSFFRLIFQFALPHDYMYVIGGKYARTMGAGLYTAEKLDVWFSATTPEQVRS